MIGLDISGNLSVKRRFDLIKLPAQKRKQLLRKIALEVRKNSRKRVRNQTDLMGRKWEGRKSGKRQKMLRTLGKHLFVNADSKGATIGYKNQLLGRIANEHHSGINETVTAATMSAKHGKPDYNAPATRKQAKALREAGYKVRRKNGKGWKAPTLKWITTNLKVGQAGIVLRTLRDEEPKKSWVIPLPARTFLGVTEHEINDMVNTIFDNTINSRV